MPHLSIEIEGASLRLRANDAQAIPVLSEKWVGFIALLCLRPVVPFEQLAALPQFKTGRRGPKSDRTIAVEIDNFRRKLRQSGIVIDKDKAGTHARYRFPDRHRITVDTAKIGQLAPAEHEPYRQLLGLGGLSMTAHVDWLIAAMRAKVAFANGDIRAAVAYHMKAIEPLRAELYLAASYAEIARYTYRADRDQMIELRDQAIEFALNRPLSNMVANIYRPRIEAAHLFQDERPPSDVITDLTQIVGHYCNDAMDIAGLCRALNTRANMMRRQFDDKAGLRDLQLASVFAITVNDPDLMQASLFNILASIEFDDTIPPQTKVRASELNYWFCEEFNVGRDTAQCSLLSSQFHLEAGDMVGADKAMVRANQLIRTARNATDVAYFFYCRAKIELAQAAATPEHQRKAIDRARVRLARADTLYRKLGNIIGLRKCDRLRQQIDTTRPE